MTSAKSIETSVTPTDSSPAQISFQPDNQTSQSNVTPDVQPFVVFLLYIVFDICSSLG